MLLVDRKDLYVLVGPEGEAINEAVLPHVALPVRIPGTLLDYGGLKVLRADPASIQRVAETEANGGA